GAIGADELDERLSGGAQVLDVAMDIAREVIQAASNARPLGKIHLAITRSTSMDCRTRRLDSEASVILIPIGVLARIRALARRFLLQVGQDQPDTLVAGSAIDVRDHPWELAPGLRPVFGEDVEDYWEALDGFNRRTPDEEENEGFADLAVLHGFHYLALHELGHIFGLHDRLLELARAHDPRIPQHLTLRALRRGMEEGADVFAAHNFAPSLIHHPSTARSADDPDLFFPMISFVVTMVFGMYDVHRKTVYDYAEGFYPHPLIRYEFWDEATTTGLRQRWTGPIDEAAEYRRAGWQFCMDCFHRLEWECFSGEFGSPEDGDTGRYVPVTALKYGGAAALVPLMRADNQLWLEVESIAERLAGS
ncbi:hypothetical protein, partial [Nonomuraea sp. NPDC049784]|uniref:hypothetical protein n=1 Tax=Nonomuraea sp. NPDC049784 TaxID=3154361 RepID=UPI0033D80F8F